MRWLAARAFRRAVTDEDVAPYLALTKSALDAGKPFEQALRIGIKGVLCSPDFLFFRETPVALDPFALASRLSYFLWSSPPDDALLQAAANGAIRKPAILRAQVERMLNDPKAAQFTENFTGQWLGLRNIEFTTPDKKLYPEHDDALQDAMLRETRLFFEELLKQDLSVSNIVDSNFTMLNERLARHYGIEGVVGQHVPPGDADAGGAPRRCPGAGGDSEDLRQWHEYIAGDSRKLGAEKHRGPAGEAAASQYARH